MNWLLSKRKEQESIFKPKLPLTWWIDDLSHEVCGLVDDPKRGLKDMPWPDCDKVYLAIDKRAFDKLEGAAQAAYESMECRGDEDCDHCQLGLVLKETAQ